MFSLLFTRTCLPIVTHVYSCYPMLTYVYSRSPMFTIVYLCLFTSFTYIYLCLPLLTRVYSCLTKFDTVYSCLSMFTRANLFTRVYLRLLMIVNLRLPMFTRFTCLP